MTTTKPFKEIVDSASKHWDAETWELYDAACAYFKGVANDD